MRVFKAPFALLIAGALIGCGDTSKSSSSRRGASTTGPVTSIAVLPPTAPPTSGTTPAPSASGPKLASITPASGPMDGGTNVTIKGSNFLATGAGETFVLFGTRAVKATPTSDTEIKVNAAAVTSSGAVDVRVINDLGTGFLGNSFTYTARAASVTFDPPVGHFEVGQAGTKITLAVKDFVPITNTVKARFGNVLSAKVAALDSSTLVAEVPNNLPPGLVTITVEEGAQTVTAQGFRVQGDLQYADLIVNEFCPNPSGADTNNDGTGTSTADEFIEIVNTTTNPVDLSYLTIMDATAANPTTPTFRTHLFPNPTTLPPGGAIVVFGGGTLNEFALRHQTGSAQAATGGSLFLTNDDTIEIRTLPGASLSGVGRTIFKVSYTASTVPAAASLTNITDGRKITANPATNADYVNHGTTQGSTGSYSPGKKVNGSKF